MDEGMDTSVDTSGVAADIDTSSDMDYSEDISSDVPEDILEEMPEDDFSETDEVSDDIPDNIEENEAFETEDYSDDISEENLDEDIPEGDSGDMEAETDETQDELPEDTEQTDEPLDDFSDESLASDLPEDTFEDEFGDMDSASETPDEIPEDVSDEETVQETEGVSADTDTEEQPTDVQEDVGDEAPADEAAETPVDTEEEQPADARPEATDETSSDETEEAPADTGAEVQPTDVQEDASNEAPTNEAAEIPTDTDEEQSVDALRSQGRETGDYETKPETVDGNTFETVGEFAPASNPYASDEWDTLEDVPFAGDEMQIKPQVDINTEIPDNSNVDTKSNADVDESAPINSVADYMSAHNYGREDFDTYSQDSEWRDLMRKEYPDYELPPLNELQSNDDIAKQLENSSAVSKADLRDFDPEFSKEFSDAIADAKKDFPDLKMNYCGTIQNQVEGIRQTIADDYEKSLRAINGDKFTDDFYKQVADDYANDMVGQFGLNDSDDAFAWSLTMPEGPYEKYNGIAINEKYASNNDLFNQAKQYEVETKHKPVGCNTSRATVDHELGHEIDNLVNASEDDYMNNLYKEFLGENNPTDNLSGYSQTNIKEFIAEGYSEYRNNPNPRDYSTKIYNRLVQLYGKRGNE